MTVPNKFRLCAVLMFKTVITLRNIESSGFYENGATSQLILTQVSQKTNYL